MQESKKSTKTSKKSLQRQNDNKKRQRKDDKMKHMHKKCQTIYRIGEESTASVESLDASVFQIFVTSKTVYHIGSVSIFCDKIICQ